MRKIIYYENQPISEEIMDPFEKFVYEKLEELFDSFMKGELTMVQATAYMGFLKNVKPFIEGKEGE